MRYCIVAGPRSGSTWLEFIILDYLNANNMNPQRLGEFLHPVVANNEQFILTNTNRIIPGNNKWLSESRTFENRMAMLLANDSTQSLTMRLFPQEYFFNFIDYIDVAKKLKSYNFKFLSLHRNVFSRALSWAVMDHTSIIHLFEENGKKYYTTFQGIKDSIDIESIQICPKNFTRILLMAVRDDIVRRMISDVVEVINVDYDNLEHDLQQIKIPVLPTRISTVHQFPYNKLVNNYDQLLDIYNKLKSTV
jgi:hypothetical protein